ncbi:MAG: DeoR/GlpR transcriptional regulator [Trueperaceae bacterium]|nr:DeoR/GlpR transcriptional regulator [Trueperaceae bacterium]
MAERPRDAADGEVRGGTRGIRARRAAVLALIHQTGECGVERLATELAVSDATVRRDLAALERQGLVDRTWGAARAHVSLRYGDAFVRRAAAGAAAKHAVALAAAQLVEPNMVVGLSGGTTCTVLARMLRGRAINIVTNAVNVATELYGARPTKVILTGGALKANSYELVGAAADGIIRSYHLDLFFFSCSGVSEAGFSRRDHAEAAVVRTFRSVSERTVLLLDQGKLDNHNPALVARLEEVDDVIVDGPLPDVWRARLRLAGTRVREVARTERHVPDAAGSVAAA